MAALPGGFPEVPVESTADEYSFRFEGSGAEYFFIFLKHLFFTLITLGIYFAWAKTERRAFIWKSLSFHDHPFRYTGTAIELLKGYALVFLGYMIFVSLPGLASVVSQNLALVVQLALVLGLVAIMPFVIYRSRNFLYSRTTWRGIRFGLIPEPRPFAKQFFVGYLMTLLSLGLYAPIQSNRLHTIMTNNTRFGSLELHYDGDDRKIFWMTLKGILLGLLTFGLYYFWYRAELERYRAAHTRVGDTAVLYSEVTGGQLFKLYLVHIVGLTLTLGLAFPWVLMYSLGELAKRFSIRGQIDFETIVQRAETEGALSEGIADALDLDFGL